MLVPPSMRDRAIHPRSGCDRLETVHDPRSGGNWIDHVMRRSQALCVLRANQPLGTGRLGTGTEVGLFVS
jgi:hypothetical protein